MKQLSRNDIYGISVINLFEFKDKFLARVLMYATADVIFFYVFTYANYWRKNRPLPTCAVVVVANSN